MGYMITLPWETDEKPCHTDPVTGAQWWLDKLCTEYARMDLPNANGLKNVAVFFVRTGDRCARLAIDRDQNILADDQTLEGMGTKLDFLKIAREK